MSVRRFASEAGLIFSFSKRARMNLSTSFAGHEPFLTLGIFVGASGLNDHHWRALSQSIFDFVLTTETVSSVRGSGAPILTHCSRSPISNAESFFFGGMVRSGFLCRTAWISRLDSGKPG